MPPEPPFALLVTGASGRIGRALRAVWGRNRVAGLPVLYAARQPGQGIDVAWDMGANPPPDLPPGLVVLHLAGRVSGSAQDLADNARAAAALRQIAGLRHVLLMSSAAVYRPAAGPIAETVPPDPVSDYGRAKLAAERAVQGPGLTVLRLANLAGADALLGNVRAGFPTVLDPIDGQAGGPERSYIGPRVLADVLARMVGQVGALPPVINLAQPGVMAMADLLQAMGQPWSFGPPRAGAVPRVVLDVALVQSLFSLPTATPAGLVADMRSLPGWPR